MYLDFSTLQAIATIVAWYVGALALSGFCVFVAEDALEGES